MSCTSQSNIDNCSVCNSLKPETRRLLAQAVTCENYRQNEVIYFAKNPSLGFYIVQEGKVSLSNLDTNGKEVVTDIVHKGDVFGENSIYNNHMYTEIATAAECTRVLFVPSRSFERLSKEDPSLGQNLLKILSHRISKLNGLVTDFTLLSAKERVVNYILSRNSSEDEPIVLSEKKCQIANQIGIRPETFSRILKQLEDGNLIQVRGKQISVLSKSELSSLSH